MSGVATSPPSPILQRGARGELVWLVIGALVVAALYWYFGAAELVAALGRPRLGYLAAYFALALLALLGYGLRWWMVTRALAASPSLPRLMSARLAGDAVGALVPLARLAGEPVRVMLTAKDTETTRATAAVTLDRTLEWLGNMVCAITYVSIFWLTQRHGSFGGAPLVFIGGMVMLLVSLAIPLMLLRRGNHPLAPLYRWGRPADRPPSEWRRRVEETERHLARFCQLHPRSFFRGLLLSFAIEGTIVAEYHCLLLAFGIDVALPTLLLVLVGSGLSQAVPTPGSLGALEATQVGVLAFAGGQAALGFVIGIVLRLHETFWMGLGLLVLLGHGATFARWRRARGVRPSAAS